MSESGSRRPARTGRCSDAGSESTASRGARSSSPTASTSVRAWCSAAAGTAPASGGAASRTCRRCRRGCARRAATRASRSRRHRRSSTGTAALPDHVGSGRPCPRRRTVDTVEGNTAVGNDSDGGEVMRRSRSRRQVALFGRVYARALGAREAGARPHREDDEQGGRERERGRDLGRPALDEAAARLEEERQRVEVARPRGSSRRSRSSGT